MTKEEVMGGMVRRGIPAAKEVVEEAVLESKRLMFHTGSVPLNLACADRVDGGYAQGKIVHVVGDSSSGKTALCLTALAEIAINSDFDSYQLIYDDAEEANEFDLEYMFGTKLAARIQPPRRDKNGEPIYSSTVQDFQDNILRKCKEGAPFVWVLDSFDSLSSETEIKKAYADMLKRDKAEDEEVKAKISGSYGMDRPKVMSQLLRMINDAIKDTASLLIVISQTRDNIDPMSPVKKTYSGGRSLKFYCSHEVWLTHQKQITNSAHKLVIGNTVEMKVGKNKQTGKVRKVTSDIFYDYGVDSIGACVDYLVNNEFWKKSKNTIIAESLGLEGMRNDLIRKIEEQGLEKKLFAETEKAWLEIEEACKLQRKSKYSDDVEET